jgi:hypothetical protein
MFVCCLVPALITIHSTMTLFDYLSLKPFYYSLEKKAASKTIPSIVDMADRKHLKDFETSKTPFDHSLWNAVLQRHVKVHDKTINGVTNINTVDYAGVATDSDFSAYLSVLEQTDPSKLPPPDQLAFWMNAYNALCINLIIKNDPDYKLQSITNLTKPGSPVWDMVAGQVNHEDISLNTIEHVKLRQQWAEPMVHACIVCASASCPNLRNEAFTSSRLLEQMQDQMKDWMSNTTKGVLLSSNQLTLSRIFLWFEADFGGIKSIREWIPQFMEDDEAIKEKVRSGRLAVRYFDYDWSINRA